ncbi:ribonuclease Y [Campylobacter sp. FMV-PI01]|uniref:Ribonuclease Y n=1 Tax=Campylobacter portucalensis TaxID=2608384 RepID=A0A6L5WFQ4_9BACT|nr:ribonuclease Y [Campylobacter portucalensis]MSN95824.1 ribonuclease Y [Campylobacter portucalensis]
MIEILIGLGAGAVGVGIGYGVTKKINDANYSVFVEQAKAKAKAIEFEAESILKDAKLSVQEAEFSAKKKYEDKEIKLQKEFDLKVDELEKEGKNLITEKENLEKKSKEIENFKIDAKKIYDEGLNLKKDYEDKINEALRVLEHSAGLTQDEAREEILRRVEEKSRGDIAHIVRKYEEEAKKEAKKRANYILAQATTRFAGEYAAERLINVVDIKNDDLKGRIIGKEGRNIKTLEMVLGVDIIIDDTPHAIVLSSFNLYRRAIATRVIEILVEDGRIQPARIEEIHKKVSDEFESSILEEGENIVMDLGLNGIHPELIKLIGKLKFRASYGQNALAHSLEVAHLAGIIAAETGGNEKLAKRAGLLHDIGKALTHEFEGSHVDLGAEVCKRYKEHPVVINAIYAHHGHEEALSVECAAVCTADALSAARPGARREVLESFLKRVSDIEEIALNKNGVKQAYAINAGREIRVMVNANLINDDEAVLVAKEIAEDIKANVQYPGEIKVSVIRETRAVNYAK